MVRADVRVKEIVDSDKKGESERGNATQHNSPQERTHENEKNSP